MVTTEPIQKTLLELRIVLCLSLLWMGSKVLSDSCMIAMSFNQKGNMYLYQEYIAYCEKWNNGECCFVPINIRGLLHYMEKRCLVKRHSTNYQTRLYLKKSPCSCVSGLAVDEILQKNDLAAISESELLKPLDDKGTEEILITDKVDC